MKAKITERTLARKEQGEIWDEYLPGFGLRIGQRKRTFFCMTRINGKQRRFTVGSVATMGLADARDKARDILRDAAKDIDPKDAEKEAKREAEQSRARNFRAVAEEYMSRPSPKKKKTQYAGTPRRDLKSGAELTRKLNVDILPAIGDTPVNQIDKADIRKLFRDKASVSPVAANRMLALVASVLSFAAKEDYVETNVAEAVDRNPEASRARYLSAPEIKTFWRTLDNGNDRDKATRHCLKFLLVTGQRRSEAAGAAWSEFDFAKDQWLIPAERTKNGLPHVVPLNDLAIDLLDDMADKDSGEYVFRGAVLNQPLSSYAVSQSMKKALPKMKFPGGRATPHDLRRTVITEMNETLKIEPHVVEAVVNHVSGAAKAGVAGVYNKALYLEQRKLALDAWGNLLREIVTGKAAPSNVVNMRAG